jgi:ABC-type spermidine/putrescine transport system permease subunit II
MTAATGAEAAEASRRLGRRSRTRHPTAFDRPRFLWVVTIGILAFLFAPVVVVTVYSFNGQSSLVIMRGLSLRWYHEALTTADWRGSLVVSVEIALITMVACAVGGTLLAFGLQRAGRRIARGTDGMIGLRLVSPETATAVASLLLFTQLGLTLSNTTIILAHLAVCLPFVAVIVHSRLVGLNPEVEDSAMDLGAPRLSAIRLVVMPALWPAIGAASMLVFVLSFDDFVTSLFTSGVGVPPLPVRIYSMLRTGVSPVVNAIGMIMMVITGAAIVGAWLLLRLARRRTAAYAEWREVVERA